MRHVYEQCPNVAPTLHTLMATALSGEPHGDHYIVATEWSREGTVLSVGPGTLYGEVFPRIAELDRGGLWIEVTPLD